MTGFMDLFDQDDQELATKVLDFYDGDQKKYVKARLEKIRRNAVRSGMVPRHRNIMKMIVDKSGLLFNGKAPKIIVTAGDGVTESVDETQKAQMLFEASHWIEFFTNFDAVVRMLKTALVMVYFNETTNTLRFCVLDQHNAAVHYDDNTGVMDTLIYSTGEEEEDDGSPVQTFRVWTADLIQDIKVNVATRAETITQVIPNPYGFIPASEFHDTNIPREGFWNEIPEDLLEVNDIYNVHLSDSEYAAAWNKHQTAVTNSPINAEDMTPQFEESSIYMQPLPRRVMPQDGPAAVGGPGKIIELQAVPGITPFFEWKGPNANLAPLDEMVQGWIVEFAADWAVNASLAGNGSADSGFKLVVKEMPNLELRKKRQRMFETGFKRLFEVIKGIVNYHMPGTFAEDSVLIVEFSSPELPIDEKLNEEVWSRKIAEGRASRVDYFMEVKGMDRAAAEEKVQEIMAYNMAQQPPTKVLPAPTPDIVTTRKGV